MRMTKNGTPDKRFKSPEVEINALVEDSIENGPGLLVDDPQDIDPNELHEKLLKENNLQLDFDVLDPKVTPTVSTQYGIIKLDKEKPILVVKASYVE